MVWDLIAVACVVQICFAVFKGRLFWPDRYLKRMTVTKDGDMGLFFRMALLMFVLLFMFSAFMVAKPLLHMT